MRLEAARAVREFPAGAARRGALSARETVRERIVGFSRWAMSAPALIASHAAHSGPILVEGEPGSGKQFTARTIHECSPRSLGPFVALSCDAMPAEAVRAILADRPDALSSTLRTLRREYFERARGGTLYVADLASLPHEVAEAFWLSAGGLADGPPRPEPAGDVRLVFGTSREIAPADAALGGRLGYLRVPPLRERVEDVAPLGDYFAARACRRLGKEERALSADALEALIAHSWPGNVAELEQAVSQMVRRAGPPALDAALLPAYIARSSGIHGAMPDLSGEINLQEEVQRYERTLLETALERCEGVQTRAARMLSTKVSTLNSKLSHYGIDASAFKPTRRRTA
jgi:DNA-binding NtrC family response regulator